MKIVKLVSPEFLIADVSEFFHPVHMRGKQGLNMDQTDQTDFQEYYYIVSSLHRQYSIIGECIGWATNTWKERGQTGKKD